MPMSPEVKGFSAEHDPVTFDYLMKVFKPEDDILAKVRKMSDEAGLPHIHVGRFDGLHLEVLTRGIGAKRIVEIGTLGGYSGICLARGGGPDAKLYTFEKDPKHAEVAKKAFQLAGVSEQSQVFVGSALETLTQIEKEGPFDLVFIDADKSNYKNYLDWAYKNLRKGGVVLGDNTLAWGLLGVTNIENNNRKAWAEGLRAFNESAAESGRFRATMIPTAEGLTMAVKL